MKRHLEPVDMMVAVGVFATVIGGYALFWAASAALQTAGSEPLPMVGEAGMVGAMEWVQPVLGQAIVDEAVLQRDASRAMTRSARTLNHATMADQWLQVSPVGHMDQIGSYAAAVMKDHTARIQFVMGRTVANFTARGVRSGVLSPATVDGKYNRTMIALAGSTGRRMDDAFQDAWQSRLGNTILAAGQDYISFIGLSQGRIGRSVVGLALVQDAYRAKMDVMQEQLASVALASINAEQSADRSVRLASAEVGGGATASPATQPRTWPEMTVGVLLAASAALVGIFLVGISVPMNRPSTRARKVEEETTRTSYRKTA